MDDILLIYKFMDRGGRHVYEVRRKVPCKQCGIPHGEKTGQELRLKLDTENSITDLVTK
jgi:hypothetical protein